MHLAANGQAVRALTRKIGICLLGATGQGGARRLNFSPESRRMPGRRRCRISGLDRPVGRLWARFGEVAKTHPASCVPLGSAENSTPSLPAAQSQQNADGTIETMIEDSGLDWGFLRPGMLASNSRHWWVKQIRAGDVVRWPCLDVPTAPIDERDIAAVAARVLCDEGHSGAEYVLTGPQSLTQFEQISTIGKVICRSLLIQEIPSDEAQPGLSAIMPACIAKMLLDAWSAAAGLPAFVMSTVEEVTGTPARTFLD